MVGRVHVLVVRRGGLCAGAAGLRDSGSGTVSRVVGRAERRRRAVLGAEGPRSRVSTAATVRVVVVSRGRGHRRGRPSPCPTRAPIVAVGRPPARAVASVAALVLVTLRPPLRRPSVLPPLLLVPVSVLPSPSAPARILTTIPPLLVPPPRPAAQALRLRRLLRTSPTLAAFLLLALRERSRGLLRLRAQHPAVVVVGAAQHRAQEALVRLRALVRAPTPSPSASLRTQKARGTHSAT
jgi:hypothetical protein